MITVTKVKALNQLSFDAADLDADIEIKVQTLVSKVSAQRKKVVFLLKKANTLAESPEGISLLAEELAKLTLYGETLETLLQFYEEKLKDTFTLRQRFLTTEQALINARKAVLDQLAAMNTDGKELSSDLEEQIEGSIDEVSLGYPEDRIQVKKGAK